MERENGGNEPRSLRRRDNRAMYIRIRIYVCMYHDTYVHVHTCYVLTIPSSCCKDFVFLRPVKILLPERGDPRIHMYAHTCYVLIIPFSRCVCFVNLRPAENLLHERRHPRVPLRNVLKMSIFLFF